MSYQQISNSNTIPAPPNPNEIRIGTINAAGNFKKYFSIYQFYFKLMEFSILFIQDTGENPINSDPSIKLITGIKQLLF